MRTQNKNPAKAGVEFCVRNLYFFLIGELYSYFSLLPLCMLCVDIYLIIL